MILADRLSIPEQTGALLFDLDGVMLDSLTADMEWVGRLAKSHFGDHVQVPPATVREYFPYPIPDFWSRLLNAVGIEPTDAEIEKLTAEHEEIRRTTALPVHDGIVEILVAARDRGLPVGVVSNNPTAEIECLLANARLRGYVDVVVGIDRPGVRPKPEPDPYLAAARLVGQEPRHCVAVEDSTLGVRSAAAAGCHTVAVATGAVPFDELEASADVDRCYSAFAQSRVELGDKGVTDKSLLTPNDFVSHMIEHIAWRLGCSVDVLWTTDDWRALGVALGRQVALLPVHSDTGASLGMIDDGSAEVEIRRGGTAGATLTSTRQVDLEWFLGLRCEQLRAGAPLVELLSGLGEGSGLEIAVTVASLEDPHHTWEGVFRAVGIALAGMCRPVTAEPPAPESSAAADHAGGVAPAGERGVERGWVFDGVSARHAKLSRRTAESEVTVAVTVNEVGTVCRFEVADSIHVAGLADLLLEFATGAGIALEVGFLATKLNSSHVVAEDVGLAIGRAIRGIAIERMEEFGIDGAGSNVATIADLADKPVRVGISMEGRKFWKYVPFQQDYSEFRRSFLIGHTLPNGLFSEDLDDFVDGIAGGLSASVMTHFQRPVDPSTGWPLLFRGLGEAVAGVLRPNPGRRGLIPGVKATLA